MFWSLTSRGSSDPTSPPQVSAFGAVLSAGLDNGPTSLAGRADAIWRPGGEARARPAARSASAARLRF